ncbi:MAG TPA: radical SAM protein [Kofleriaceae bacterium]|nr:radical SAM protein [Kofleriaceae bacterium]
MSAAALAPVAGRLVHSTTSLCKECKQAVAADVIATEAGEVWMTKTCAQHGWQQVRLSTSAAWYERTRAIASRPSAPAGRHEVDRGCPFDCGPCASHTQKVRLPVVTITSACNLDCPICYVHNKNDDAYHMSVGDFDRVLAHLRDEHGAELDIVNLTGGEPFLHPRLWDFLEHAQAAGIHRVTVCSNGLKLAKDEAVVARLAALGARVALSFDSFEAGADFALQGAHLVATKLRTLELLEQHGVPTTLIPVMTRGVNDHEIGAILELGLRLRCVRHLEIHTITYTGQGGVRFDRSGRISMLEVLERIAETTGGLLAVDDFVPSPCAHPLCYQIAYLLVDPAGGPPIPFTRFLSADELYRALADRLYLEPTPALEEALHGAIDRLWAADEGDREAARVLAALRRLLDDLYPAGGHADRLAQLAAGERWIKAVYVHSHMDEETFDTERAAECCDSNCYADGRTIPVCNYNVLYRDTEARFVEAPRDWGARDGGVRGDAARPRSLPVVR